MEKLTRCVITFALSLSILLALVSCGPTGNTSQSTTSSAGTTQSSSSANNSSGSDVLGQVSPCGTHNDKPFYIGYADNFGDALNTFTAVDFSEDAQQADGSSRIAVYVPGGSTRVAVVHIDYNQSDDSFSPLTNVGWTALTASEYLTFVAAVPQDVPNLAVVVYSDNWEAQQAFALKHDPATGLLLVPVVLDE